MDMGIASRMALGCEVVQMQAQLSHGVFLSLSFLSLLSLNFRSLLIGMIGAYQHVLHCSK